MTPDSEKKYSPEQEVAIRSFISQQQTDSAMYTVEHDLAVYKDVQTDFGRRPNAHTEEAMVTRFVEREFSFNPLPSRAAALLTSPDLSMPFERVVTLFHGALVHQAEVFARSIVRLSQSGEVEAAREVDEYLIDPARANWQAFEALTGLHTEMPQPPIQQ